MPLLREVMQNLHQELESAGIPDARLEAEVMLVNVLRVPRHRLYAFQEQPVDSQQEEALAHLVQRRHKREPLAYILGHREFYGVDLLVRPSVLIPRPETELLVEQALFLGMMRMEEGSLVIAEPGTGSGCISIALAIHLATARIYATDLYTEALEVAQFNVHRHNVADRVTLLEGDLLEPVPEAADIIVANLPYIPSGTIDRLQPEVQWEPRHALDGGPDGLDIVRRTLAQAQEKLKPGGAIILEIDPQQVEPLKSDIASLFPDATVSVEQDLAHLDRVLIINTGAW